MQYAWLIWSLILIGIWGVIYFFLNTKNKRREMLIVSLWTSAFGLTEPLFVPEYWSPPSLFKLALRTGFDIESLIFSFGIGGIAVIIYELILKTRYERISSHEQYSPQHRHHLIVLFSPPVIFFLLLVATPINPIYIAIISMTGGGLFSWYCRPDLEKKNDHQRGNIFRNIFSYAYCYVSGLCGKGLEFKSYLGNFNFGYPNGK